MVEGPNRVVDKWQRGFWRNIDKNPANVLYIAASSLERNGLDVKITGGATDISGNPRPNESAIYAIGSAYEIINKVADSPELKILQSIQLGRYPLSSSLEKETFESTSWNDETKTRVLAYWHTIKARKFKGTIEGNYDELVENLESKSKAILGDLPPFTFMEMRKLVHEVVDRTLVSSQNLEQ